jgi:hypothetical protein
MIIQLVIDTEDKAEAEKIAQNILENKDFKCYGAVIMTDKKKVDVWYIEACTGCSCCANENFDQGFYFNEEEPQKIFDEWKVGNGNPLASQYATYGRYYLHKEVAEMLGDGRMIVNGSLFDVDDGPCHICW